MFYSDFIMWKANLVHYSYGLCRKFLSLGKNTFVGWYVIIWVSDSTVCSCFHDYLTRSWCYVFLRFYKYSVSYIYLFHVVTFRVCFWWIFNKHPPLCPKLIHTRPALKGHIEYKLISQRTYRLWCLTTKLCLVYIVSI